MAITWPRPSSHQRAAVLMAGTQWQSPRFPQLTGLCVAVCSVWVLTQASLLDTVATSLLCQTKGHVCTGKSRFGLSIHLQSNTPPFHLTFNVTTRKLKSQSTTAKTQKGHECMQHCNPSFPSASTPLIPQPFLFCLGQNCR
jgi:hypothetical protein